MDINDIEQKKNNDLLKFVQDKLGIPSFETLSAEEINAIVDAIKNRPPEPIWTGDPLDEYISYRNQ